MKRVKAYAPDGENVTIACPGCGAMRHGSLRRIRVLKHSFLVRCSCGTRFNVVLELRKAYRKATYLLGTFRRPASDPLPVVIENLSLGGVGFSLDPDKKLLVGERITISFSLDDARKTPVTRRATVRHVHDGYAGCEFQSHSGSDRDLGFYLMP